MSYKRKKLTGPPIKRGGYFPVKDYMEHYKVPLQQEDEYHRKLRHEIEKNESSLSHFKESVPHYKIIPMNLAEESKSSNNVDDLRDLIFRDVMLKLKEENKEISPEIYEGVKEESELISNKFAENSEKNILDFTDELLTEVNKKADERTEFLLIMNEARLAIIDDKWKDIDDADNLKEIQSKFSEIRETNDIFFDCIDSELRQDNVNKKRFDITDEVGY